MQKLTAIIPTLNEESNIQRALDSVSFANEIIVIDSYSSDRTVEIVKSQNIRLLQREFDDFSNQKNYAIQHATHQWVLLVDADEEVSTKLKNEIQKTLKSKIEYSAFIIKRAFYFKKKRVYYSGFQNGKVIRFFKKDSCHYEGKVHEKLIVSDNSIGCLNYKLKHFSYQNNRQYKRKLNQYAKLQALELFDKNKMVTPYHLFIKPMARFIVHYFIRLGFLDGKKGYILSSLQAYGVKKRYIELNKLRKNK